MTRMRIDNNSDSIANEKNVAQYETIIWKLLDDEFEGGDHNGMEVLSALAIIVKKLSKGMGVTVDVEVGEPNQDREGKEL